MGVRLEWTTAGDSNYVRVYAPGEEADDGQTAEGGNDHYVLVIDGLAIEGTRSDILRLLARATEAVALAPQQISDEIANDWLEIYEHAIPDPDEHDENHVPTEDRERFEHALKSVHDYMSERRA